MYREIPALGGFWGCENLRMAVDELLMGGFLRAVSQGGVGESSFAINWLFGIFIAIQLIGVYSLKV